jgi:protochlorophyllide reductase
MQPAAASQSELVGAPAPAPRTGKRRAAAVVFFVALTVAYTGGWLPSVGFAAAPLLPRAPASPRWQTLSWQHRVAPILAALPDADLPLAALQDGASALDAAGVQVSGPALATLSALAQPDGGVHELARAHAALAGLQRRAPAPVMTSEAEDEVHDLSTAPQDVVRAGEKVKALGQRLVNSQARLLIAKTREIVVVTGASSGLGLAATKALTDRGYFVICAVRDVDKMEAVAKERDIKMTSFLPVYLELGSLKSVREFARELRRLNPLRPLNHLICNAAVYRPTDPKPAFTEDGYELSFGINHLGHFLLLNSLLPDLKKVKGARVTVVGSITGNDNTIGGGFVFPKANIGELQGIKQGPGAEMVDGGSFDGAKAYKDAKSLNMMTMTELHRRYHEETGITFNTMYPGCIADTALFREKRGWFRTAFPFFMKYVTGGYVSEPEAGERLAQLIYDPLCAKSGVYWGWNGNAQQIGMMKSSTNEDTGKTKWEVRGAGGSGGQIEEIPLSGMNRDQRRAGLAWEYSMDLVQDFLDQKPPARRSEKAEVM